VRSSARWNAGGDFDRRHPDGWLRLRANRRRVRQKDEQSANRSHVRQGANAPVTGSDTSSWLEPREVDRPQDAVVSQLEILRRESRDRLVAFRHKDVDAHADGAR
jgi:hypothetical protein